MDRLTLLREVSFGSQVAEEEIQNLASYFVQTDQWNRMVKGDVDMVRGEKGVGKSAIYLLLGANASMLFDRGVLVVNAENPRGATVFKDLIADPPTSEQEFVVLWKIYILVLICYELRALGVTKGHVSSVYIALEEAKLLEPTLNLSGLLRSAQIFARQLLNQRRLEAGVEFDPNSGAATGFIARITLAEPSSDLRDRGFNSIDGLFEKVNEALSLEGYTIWVLLDRLDVAFTENHALEANALRALIRVYSDLRALDCISLKIFLREDIWKRITEGGMREASHLIRVEVVNWTSATLLNLLMRRLLSNRALVETFGIDPEDVLADSAKQDALFDRFFPEQVEQGPQKAKTFKWMLTRCADGTGKTAPRELIHLLNSIRAEEVRRLERGGKAPPEDQLFDRSVFKAALPIVSDTRLRTYMYAEFPAEKPYVERLEGRKAEQTPESLSDLWGMGGGATVAKARDLVALGFFEERGTRHEPTFWVPFLYRDALHLVQGRAETEEDGDASA